MPRQLFFFEFGNPKVTVHKGAETIQGRQLFKGGNDMRKYGICKLLPSRSKIFGKFVLIVIQTDILLTTVGKALHIGSWVFPRTKVSFE